MNAEAQIDIDDTEPDTKLKTGELQALLSAKYPRDRYALFFDVPDNVGTDSRRRADAIAIGCWSSVGRLIEGFELKVSRSDWLREVANVSKADPFIERCDKWWLVTASPSIAKLDEVPACWGWMAATKNGLRVQRPATRLPHDDTKINRLFAIGLFRKMQESLVSSPEVAVLLRESRQALDKKVEEEVTYRTHRLQSRTDELQKRIEKFEKDSGLKLDTWRLGDVGALAKAIHELHEDGYRGVSSMLARQDEALTELLTHIREARTAIAETPPSGETST